MKNLLYITLILLLLSCGGAKQATLTPYEQEVNAVINALLPNQDYIDTNDLVAQGLVAAKEYQISGLERNGLSKTQAAQINARAKDTVVFKLDTKSIAGQYRWLPLEKEEEMFKGANNTGWELLLKEYGENSYSIISKPLFSADYTVAVVVLRHTNEWRMGSGRIYLLKKINGKWHCKGKIGGWIS